MDKQMISITKSIRFLLFAVVLITSSLESTFAEAGNAMSASDLNNVINEYGEKSAIGRVISDTALYSKLIRMVEQASPEWVQIACRLRLHADAGFASELESALSLALSKRPDLVLDKLDEQYVQGVCSGPFFIDYPDMKTGLKILERTRSGLLNLKSEKLAKKKTTCLPQIEEQINKIHDDQINSKQSQLPSEKMRK